MKRIPCRRIEPLLGFASGEDLSSSRAAVVEEHLRTCGNCRLAAEEFAATVHTIRGLPALRVSSEESAALRRGVWDRIEKDRATLRVGPRGGRGTAWRAAGWAAAGLVALALLLPWRPAGRPPETRRVSRETSPPPALRRIPKAAQQAPATAAAQRLASAEKTPRVARRGAPRRARASAESNEPVRIELSTPDPDVRIVWLVGSPREDLPPLRNDDDDTANTTATAPTKEDPE